MRLRTLLTLSAGAAAGAGATYWLDPDHGPDRRRLARRNALRQIGTATRRVATQAARRSRALGVAAVDGYRQGRLESAVPSRATTTSVPRAPSRGRTG